MKTKIILFMAVLLVAISACNGGEQVVDTTEPVDSVDSVQPELDENIEPSATPEPTEIPAPSGKIVFSSNRGENPGKLDLHVLDVGTGEFSEIETDLLVSFFPKWSPDGSTVMYVDPLPYFIYTIKEDGTEKVQVTNIRSNNGDWSPDGSQIVFQSDHDNEPQDTPDLYVIDADGSDLEEILDDPPQIDFSPRWSPNGDQVLFISMRTGSMQMYTLDLSDLAFEQISDFEMNISEAVWSPDGSRIAFSADGGSGSDIYAVDADGVSNLLQLTNDGNANLYPCWSPDGSWIVYSSKASGNTDLWMVLFDGSEKTQLTDDEWDDLFPDWIR